jgi:hypothetical protein
LNNGYVNATFGFYVGAKKNLTIRATQKNIFLNPEFIETEDADGYMDWAILDLINNKTELDQLNLKSIAVGPLEDNPHFNIELELVYLAGSGLCSTDASVNSKHFF